MPTYPRVRAQADVTDGTTAYAAPLIPTAVLTAATTAVAGKLNRYDATSGALAPAAPAVGGVGAVYQAQKTDASTNAVTIGSETLAGQGDRVTFVSDGTSWISGGVQTTRASQTATYGPLPVGTPTVGQVPLVTAASPLALGWGNLTSGAVTMSGSVSSAFGNGVTDATSHIQSVIDACPAGGAIYVPRGTYLLTAALTIVNSISIFGESSTDVFGSRSTGFDRPGVSPFISGVVLMQSTAGANGITISGTGPTVNLENIGINFATAIRWSNTGHGIYAVPSALLSGQPDHGVMGAHWRNVRVHGHDGNHYAFYMVNPCYCTLAHLRAYGGGGLLMKNDSNGGNYGNSVVSDFYSGLILGGSAHGIYLARVSGGGLNLMSFVRPQVNLEVNNVSQANPTSAQKCMLVDSGVETFTITQPDFESTISGCDFGSTNQKLIDPVGYFGTTTYQTSNARYRTAQPTYTSGPGAGTNPATPTGTGDDYSGAINVTVGNPVGSGVLLTVNYARVFFRDSVILTPLNASAQTVGLYVSARTGNGFSISATGTLAPGASYAVAYQTCG